jgi:serine/threonine protein kinase
VYLGQEKETRENVAIKVVKLRGVKQESIRNEIEIMKRVQHENIIACLDLFETEDNLYLVMELCVQFP